MYQVISTLVSSDKYYLDGNLIYKPDGSFVDRKYFCETFADVVSAKFVDCNWTGNVSDAASHYNLGTHYGKTEPYGDFCQGAVTRGAKAQIITPDGVTFYETNQPYHFASKWTTTGTSTNNPDVGGQLLFNSAIAKTGSSDAGFNEIYKPFCIDIDGIGKGEAPFAYGIRFDGKVVMDQRAKEWLSKSIQGEN